jgi:uncharacterized secreted repeat protein (TIGR03808 family)
MPVDRRAMLAAGLSLGATASLAAAGPRQCEAAAARGLPAHELSLRPGSDTDQTAALQAAIDQAALARVPLVLAPGEYLSGPVVLRPGSHLIGTPGRTVLKGGDRAPLLSGDHADDVRLQGLRLEGSSPSPTPDSMLLLRHCRAIVLHDLDVRRSAGHGISLEACSGRLSDCRVSDAGQAGIFSIDATGLEIVHNHVADCANNGILVWRSHTGEDGTLAAHNRIERIGAAAGGSGQNGNGINVFRSGGVLVSGNRITDCAYSAVRGNAASNIGILGNGCERLGEVALYAEFGFEGALVANNLVDGAACGISVTNFNEGGRLAVVQGNIVRNLRRREHEPVDKRGEGIAIEADAAVTGNVIESAATAGIVIGWGRWMRDVAVTSNVIRKARVGIVVTSDPEAGACLIASNLISGASHGAIRGMMRGALAGPDLLKAGAPSERLALAGNIAVDRPG